jgi:hypothetical protein
MVEARASANNKVQGDKHTRLAESETSSSKTWTALAEDDNSRTDLESGKEARTDLGQK